MAVKDFDWDGQVDFGGTKLPEQTPIDNVVVIEQEVEPRKGGQHPIVVLVLDRSGSMNATDTEENVSRIELVKRYAKDFVNTQSISAADKELIEFCVVTFGSDVEILQDFTPMSESKVDFDSLQAGGLTSLYSALIVAVKLARERKNKLIATGTPCFKPVIFLVTDGRPEGENDLKMEDACRQILHSYVDAEDGKSPRMRLFVCGMDKCDMSLMDSLCDDKQIIALRNADALKEAFALLTKSVAAMSVSDVNDLLHLSFENIENLGVLKGHQKVAKLN